MKIRLKGVVGDRGGKFIYINKHVLRERLQEMTDSELRLWIRKATYVDANGFVEIRDSEFVGTNWGEPLASTLIQ